MLTRCVDRADERLGTLSPFLKLLFMDDNKAMDMSALCRRLVMWDAYSG